MEPEPPQEKGVDEVLDQIDWEKLGVEDVEEKAEHPLPARPELPLPARPELPLPAKIELFHRGSDIEIVRRWFSWETVLGTAGILFVGWLIFRFYPNLGRGRALEDIIWFPIFVALVVWGTYYTIAGWLNRTHILVSRAKITVRHRPIPWLGNKEINASDVKQLHTEEHVQRSGKGGKRVTYDVHVILSNGRRTKLVDALRSSEQAYFIEHQIETYLGIEDTM